MSILIRYNIWKRIYQIVRPERDEKFCTACKGVGAEISTSSMKDRVRIVKCRVCNGDGRIDWVKNATSFLHNYQEKHVYRNEGEIYKKLISKVN